VKEFGDLDIADHFPGDAAEVITSAVSSALQSVDALVILGGDSSVTRPAVRGLGQPIAECGLLTLDAHLDLRDLEGGQTNSNPIRGLLEDGLPGHNIVQIGIQAFVNSESNMDLARRAGIRVVDVEQVRGRGIESVVRESLADLSRVARCIYVDFRDGRRPARDTEIAHPCTFFLGERTRDGPPQLGLATSPVSLASVLSAVTIDETLSMVSPTGNSFSLLAIRSDALRSANGAPMTTPVR
jgi:hypothetical protein